MKLSIHQYVRGKPVKVVPLEGSSYMESNGHRVNLGYDWVNIDAGWPDVFELITGDGCATSAELSTDNRSDANFVSRELFMVDIDSGMNIQDLADNDFYNDYGAGFYTTPSHTQDNHRFRIMFRTEQPITNPAQAKKLMQALLRVYDHADPACKDSTRIFYGTKNCGLCLLTDRKLPVAMIQALWIMEDMFREEQQPASIAIDTREYLPKSLDQIEELLNQLRKHYADLNYQQRRDVTWAVAGQVSNPDTVRLLRSRWDDSDKTGRYEMFVNARKSAKITIGTIYHMIRQRDPGYARHTPLRFDSNTGSKIYTGIEAISILQQERYKIKGIIRNG